jgi:hypothetical protein
MNNYRFDLPGSNLRESFLKGLSGCYEEGMGLLTNGNKLFPKHA